MAPARTYLGPDRKVAASNVELSAASMREGPVATLALQADGTLSDADFALISSTRLQWS